MKSNENEIILPEGLVIRFDNFFNIFGSIAVVFTFCAFIAYMARRR